MSTQTTVVFQIVCDGLNCKQVLCDDEIGWLVFRDEESAKAAVTNESLVSDEDEWTAVGDLHFCWHDGCQREAKDALVQWKARQPVPPLPGQLDLLAEVAR